jgi:hypothetical protein
VQTFANDFDARGERDYFDYLIAAFLLNILFVVKISGLVLGLAMVVGGCIVRGRFSRGLVEITLVLLFLAVMIAIDFVITGTSLFPVIQEYRLAAQAKADFFSVRDALWFASRLPVVGIVVLTALYVVSRPGTASWASLWRCFFIIASFWVCQVVLNMTNSTLSPALIFLAPAAAVALVTWTNTSDALHPRRLNEIFPREVIPLLVLGLVFVPEALAALVAVKLDYSILSGTTKTKIITVSANKGITFELLPNDPGDADNALSVNRAILAIEGLGASRETIVNLDFMNPFPALFLAPAPKGVPVYWDFGERGNVPFGHRPGWREILGDACIITEPKHPIPPAANYSEPLIDAVQPRLTSAFTLVYQDELWKIWRNNGGCNATGGSSPILTR